MLAAVVWILARRLGGGSVRATHLSAAAGVGWVGLPALGAAVLHLRPAPGWLLAGVVAAVGLSVTLAVGRHGPAGIGRVLASSAAAVVGGTLVVLLIAGLFAAAGATDPVYDERRAIAIYDLDAAVATRPLRACSNEPVAVEVLTGAGAHPRVGPEGRLVWFDAVGPDGRRQIHRLDLATRVPVCWTCGEPGNNVRPAPGNRASGLAFDTDRHATFWDPTNTEIHLVRAHGEAPPPPSRRLTYTPGPDDHAILAHASALLIWSRFADGSYRVVSAPIRSAHGGLQLGGETLLAAGGARWTAPLAWSPDARSLVVMRGNPFRPLPAVSIDFAADRRRVLLADAAGGGAVSFSDDGGRVVVAGARRTRVAGLLPSALGFVLGPLAVRADARADLFRGTSLHVGESGGDLAELALGEVADWGEPTGVSLLPDGESLVLGQRRRVGGGFEERLLEIRLGCSSRSS